MQDSAGQVHGPGMFRDMDKIPARCPAGFFPLERTQFDLTGKARQPGLRPGHPGLGGPVEASDLRLWDLGPEPCPAHTAQATPALALGPRPVEGGIPGRLGVSQACAAQKACFVRPERLSPPGTALSWDEWSFTSSVRGSHGVGDHVMIKAMNNCQRPCCAQVHAGIELDRQAWGAVPGCRGGSVGWPWPSVPQGQQQVH